MPRIICRAALIGIVAVGSIATGSQTTFAHDAHYKGDAGKLNMWEDDSYSGQHESRYGYDSDFNNDSFNDELSSYINKTDNWWKLYEHNNYGGGNICVRPHSHDNNIGNNTTLEDDISSVDEKGPDRPLGCDVVIGEPNNA